MNRIKIVIEMDGGLVQGVYSETPIEFVIVDYDRRGDDTAVSRGYTEPLRRMPKEVQKMANMGPKDWSPR